MALNQVKPWEEEVATSDKMNRLVSNQLLHVFTSETNRNREMNRLLPTGSPPGSVACDFHECGADGCSHRHSERARSLDTSRRRKRRGL